MPTQSSSGRSASKIVHAAGGVLWRPGHRESAAEIAVIHRPRYDDWSLPKGKVDPGETEPVTAVREVFEETGHHVQLGRRIATVSYPIEQRTKKVQYWSARSLGGSFAPTMRSTISSGCPPPPRSKRCPTRTTERYCAGGPNNRRTPNRFWWSGTAPQVASPDSPATIKYDRWTRRAVRRPRRSSPAVDLRSHRCLRGRSTTVPPDSRAARRGAGRSPQQWPGTDRRGVRRQPEAGSAANLQVPDRIGRR